MLKRSGRAFCTPAATCIAAVLAAILGGPAPAVHAYVLQGPHVLELMLDHLGKGQRLQVDQMQVIHGVGEGAGTVEVAETLRYHFPGGFRSDIATEDLQRIHVVAQGRRLTVTDGRPAPGDDRLADLYKDLMLYRSRNILIHRLAALGVDTDISSYGLIDGQVAYVVGARYPDASVPQVWVDKETFRPLRWIVRPALETGLPPRLEIRYGSWVRHEKRWYPKEIALIQDGNPARTIRVTSVKANPTFAPETFDIAHLRSTYRTASPIDSQGEDTDRLKEVRETIEEFKKLYE